MIDLVRFDIGDGDMVYVAANRINSISRHPADPTKTMVVWECPSGEPGHAMIDTDPDEFAQMLERSVKSVRLYNVA